ncbi:VOC family protein [Congregibacter sp.]|uniref:VOC family protein n=1 Tax=Congregibacter sp. TaxID=2744308 RepID=UPI003F6CC176
MASPIRAIDHVTISVADLEADANHYATLFATPPVFQGQRDGKETAVFQTGNIAVHLHESGKPLGLEGICFAGDTLPRMKRRLSQVGIAAEEDIAHDPHGSEDHHPVIVADPATTRHIQLSFIEQTHRSRTDDRGLGNGLDHIVIASQKAESTAFLLGCQLGLDLRMDMSRPEWNARLMFFRCDDLIVEVFEQLKDEAVAGARDLDSSVLPGDSFYGLTWRVTDADASHMRLRDAGFDVSGVRKGRKPGSRVLTVRNKTAGVATLLIELPKS